MRQLPIRPKLLLFYGGTIAAVLVLFRLTTAYGETQLQAPPNVGGTYVSTIAPPGCPADSRLQLTVQQSGIYLNGSAELLQAKASSESHSASSEKLPLTGRWQGEKIALAGSTDAFVPCQTAQNTALNLTGTIAPSNPSSNPQSKQLTATLQLNNTSPWSFTADRQEKPKTAEH